MGDPTEDRAKADKYPPGDILAILYRQHADITEGLDRVSQTRGDERRRSFAAVTEFMKAHETAEQKVVRPVIQGTATEYEADARTAEEQEADQKIAALAGLDVDSDEFTAQFETLKQAVSEHAESEEGEEFPIIEGRPEAERADLGNAFLDAQEGK